MSSEWLIYYPHLLNQFGVMTMVSTQDFRLSPSNDQQHLPMEHTLSRPYSKATLAVTKTMFMQFI